MRLLFLLLFVFGVSAGPKVETALNRTTEAVFAKFPELKHEQLAMTAIDLGDLTKASFRGDAPIYPASVVKLFYLEATHRWLEDGKLTDTPELRRAMKDMIVLSYNEATHLVLDMLTDTTSGPELTADEMTKWSEKRNAVNRYFARRGFEKINVNQKPWCEGPYGRDRVFVGQNYENRNALTTDATARLLMEIATLKAVTMERSKQMLELLSRDPKESDDNESNQVKGFSGSGLPEGAKLWSKAGWTSTTRHDAAFVELLNGKKFVLVTFTLGHASDTTLIPFTARTFCEEFSK